MTFPVPSKRRRLTTSLCVLAALLLLTGRAHGDTTLFAWDVADEDLWTIDTATPPSGTFVGGGNASFIAEIEYGFGVIYGADTGGDNTNLRMIDPDTGLIFSTISLSYPLEGNVLTALEFVGTTLYAGLTTEGGGPTFLATVDLITGFVTVVGATGVDFPFGGLAYDMSTSQMYAISAGGSSPMLYTVNLATGAATSVGPVTVGGQAFKATALEFGGDGVLYTVPALTDPLFGRLLTIDPATALATDLGSPGLTQGAVALTWETPASAFPDTTLLSWDPDTEDLWSIETFPPPSATLIGGGNTSIIAEIEAGNGVVYGANTFPATDFHVIDRTTGLIVDTITLTYPPEGNVLTALEFVGDTLYAGLTTGGGGPTYLSTVNLGTGVVTVVGPTGVSSPFGGLAYDTSMSTMYAISAGGSSPTLYTIDLMTGAATAVGPVTAGGQPFWATALEFGGDGVLYTVPARRDPLYGRLLMVDPATAVAIDLGSAGLATGAVALTYDAVLFLDGFELGDTSAWSQTVP